MAELKKDKLLDPEVAIQHIDEAPLIMEDGGKRVFGWVVQSPLRAAFSHLSEAIASLDGVSGAEKQLARAHQVYGDIASQDQTMQNPIKVAETAYKKAIDVLKKVDDYDGIAKITEKLTALNK